MLEDELLVGDVVKINPGIILSVDGIVISGNEIECDEQYFDGS